VAVLESDLEPEQVVRHIIADTGLTTEFSRGTHAEMERLPASPDISSGQGRVDLRNRLFVTIDGKDARDFDDAVCLEAMENGNWRLLVSIADVAEYVLPGTAVDDDAYRKGTSVYFPGQVYPMLPHALSNDLCSLKPRVPRLCLTCEMELTAGGQRVGHRIFESTIRSQARLTYGQVQQYFDTGTRGTLTGPVAAMLAEMRRLAKVLRDKRSKRGSLDFTFPEYRFDLDQKGYPKRINVFYPNEATRLIEQLMLEANEAVAWEASRLELPILYRVHDPPPGDLVDDLLLKLWNFGLSASREDLLSSPGLKGILAQARDNPRFEQIELAVLKSLSQARYREENSGHFALGAEHYTHFTSPIRRYPDLLLHRALKSHIRKRPEPPALPANAGLALSTLERIASEAEQRVNRLYKVMFMEKHVGEVFNGTVTGLSERGVQLSLDEYPVDGWLPSEKIPGPRLRYDRRKDILTASGRRPVKLGDRLSVQLNRADRLTQELDFSLISWGEKKSRKPEK
ncbi:MAG: VacB/RNase II family 3'-5' exoribonuclease, partial [Deltaproteobacteria bacterium]|nr:VacB/RNase II family 3'-5' exoribonuclease [Deltaproteobacteria bacterium]